MVAVLTAGWLLLWVVIAVSRLRRGSFAPVWIVIIIHCFLSGFGPVLDLIVRVPDLHTFPIVESAANDQRTSDIYCAYMAVVPVILAALGHRRHKLVPRVDEASSTAAVGDVPSWLRLGLIAGMASPVLALICAPDPAVYRHYGAALSMDPGTPVGAFHAYVALFGRIAILSAGIYNLIRPGPTLHSVMLSALPCVVGLWLIGKRADVALFLVVFTYSLWRRNLVPPRTLVRGILASTVLMAAFSNYYQSAVRVDQPVVDSYSGYRIDYGRDLQIKTSVYALEHPELGKVLEYAGQSYKGEALFFVPRSVWPEKPLPYSQYLTAAALGTSPRDFGWGITTSWLDEALSNLGWWGLLFGPASLAIFCRAGDRRESPELSFLTTVIAAFLLAIQVTAIMPLVALWVLAWLRARKQFHQAYAEGDFRAASRGSAMRQKITA